MNATEMKIKLRIAFIAEYFAGGFYLKLAEGFENQPEIAERLRKTAGDEIRHGGYFNRCYEEQFGTPLGFRKQLIEAGKGVGTLNKYIPTNLVSAQKRLDLITKGEAAAVNALEKELFSAAPNPYLAVVERILPDERTHAERYHLAF